MKTITSLLFAAALTTGVYAGAPAISAKGGKAVTPPAPTCDWFAAGAKLGVFGGGFLDNGNNPETGGDALGGGILGEYFFCENFGVQVSYGAYATSSTHHEFDGDLIARYPIQSICVAPYVLAGGGFASNSDNHGDLHVGGGVEAHLTGKIGVFADGAYHWQKDDSNFTLVRLGLKFRL